MANIIQVRRIVETIEESVEDLSDKVRKAGEEFFSGVLHTSRDILMSAERRGEATPGQWKALSNMLAGVRKWRSRDDDDDDDDLDEDETDMSDYLAD